MATALGTTDTRVSGIAIRWLFESPSVGFTLWHCRVDSPGLTAERQQHWHVVAFPYSGSYRLHSPYGTTFVDTNTMAFFNANVPYRTSHPNGCGDYGCTMVVAPEVLADALAVVDPEARGRTDSPFRRCGAPSPPELYLRVRLLLGRLQHPQAEDPLDLEESGLRLLEAIAPLAAGCTAAADSQALRGAAERVDAVRGLLDRRFREATSLADVARAVELSPYHLCRVFRRCSGLTVHRYIVGLRLREAMDRIADGAEDLTAVALDVGFSSHSHFSAAFRREFGISPSRVREVAASGGLNRLKRERALLPA